MSGLPTSVAIALLLCLASVDARRSELTNAHGFVVTATPRFAAQMVLGRQRWTAETDILNSAESSSTTTTARVPPPVKVPASLSAERIDAVSYLTALVLPFLNLLHPFNRL